ncbi:VOC family protein [Paenibacillus ihbetae]|uniref:Glyoxalase n=1 Tax=Paenibacillus ihbetae TaxID=1870820 RepID=A0A1B2DZ74_9BACL|nr:VOC family protein [Paenibacillus ihbetae]ANY73044.1 glyoxalase [Paenibacillus ihbetae]OOC58955.1 glyoxalase [Paenibacillus ihbetae]
MAITPHRVAVIQWPVKDVEKSLKWYQELLGVQLSFPYTPGDPAAWLCIGDVGFGLVQAEDIPRLQFTDSQGKLQPIVQLQVDEIQEVYRHLQNSGVTVSEMRYIEDGGYSFSFTDPDGNHVSLWGGWPSPDEERPEQAMS